MKIKKLLVIYFALIISLSFLSSDVYAQKKKVATTKKSTVSAKGNLSIEAGLVFKNGDVKPVARVEFRLLDNDLENILKEAGVETEGNKDITRIMVFASHQSLNRTYNSNEKITGEDAIKQHTIATITSDFSGKGVFENVKTGKYYLMAIGGAGKQVVIWNIPIEIKSGKQSITLDNNNAAFIY